MKKLFVVFLLLPALSFSYIYAENLSLKLEQSYEYDTVFARIFFDAVVDQDGDLILAFGVPGCTIVNSETLDLVAPAGKGPGDLSGYFALNILGNLELDIEGFAGKVHVFKKQNGVYKWQRDEIREIKRSFSPSDACFFRNKWLVAEVRTSFDNKKARFEATFLHVYSDKGKFVKDMITEIYDEPWSIHLLYCFLAEYKNQVFFLSENKLLLRIITGDNSKVAKTVNLEIPKFYQKMPKGFYYYNNNGQTITSQDFWKSMALWKTGYSRICNVLVDGRWLIVQVRTADEDNKLFGLLFYDADTFELKHTIMTNDLLLANKDGKLYFFRGGNPTWDDVEDTVFDIYKIVETK